MYKDCNKNLIALAGILASAEAVIRSDSDIRIRNVFANAFPVVDSGKRRNAATALYTQSRLDGDPLTISECVDRTWDPPKVKINLRYLRWLGAEIVDEA